VSSTDLHWSVSFNFAAVAGWNSYLTCTSYVLKLVTYQATLPAGSTPDSCCIELTNPGSVLRLTQLSTTWRQAAHFIPIHPTWRVASRQSTESPAGFYRCTPWIGDSSPGRTARASTTQVSIMSRSTQQQLPEASGTRQAPAPAPAPPPPQSTPARRPVPSARSSNTTHTSPGTTLAASPSGTSGSRTRRTRHLGPRHLRRARAWQGASPPENHALLRPISRQTLELFRLQAMLHLY
jgi:hypothetical protein